MEMTRREFNRLVALGTGAELLARIPSVPEDRKIGYCIVGLGRISMQHFMPAVKMSNKSRITALVSGQRDKAERMAAEYGVPSGSIYNYANYDEIAKNPAVDAVYIALPNSMHADYSIRAAKAGKHVLCEKPMATSVEQCRAMIQACESARRKLGDKRLDLVVANRAGVAGEGFGSDTNRVTFVTADGDEELPLMSKDAVAAELLDRVERRIDGR